MFEESGLVFFPCDLPMPVCRSLYGVAPQVRGFADIVLNQSDIAWRSPLWKDYTHSQSSSPATNIGFPESIRLEKAVLDLPLNIEFIRISPILYIP